MKKLEDYKGQKIAINFPTYELWLRRKEINPSDELNDNYWFDNKENTFYYVDDRITGQFGSIFHAKLFGYTILPATDFLEEEFIYGQEYEFSDDKDFKYVNIKRYLCKRPDGKFLAWDDILNCNFTYNYARKINTERTEAITTIKELVSKFSINQNEVF